MNRRTFLVAGGGATVALAGGTAVANATRADLLANGELTRGQGESTTLEETISRASVEYLEPTDQVRTNGHTRPFETWARRESAALGAREVVSVIEDRLEKSIEGVGSGVRYLIFGPVVTVDHTVTRDRDGSIVSAPTVSLDRVIAVAPGTITVTVDLEGRSFTTELPVGVGHREVSMDSPRRSS